MKKFVRLCAVSHRWFLTCLLFFKRNVHGPSLLSVMLMSCLLLASGTVLAETVEISNARTTMQDLEVLAGGATPKTALVKSTGSVTISSETESALWGKANGWSVTIASGASVRGGKLGVNFNTKKDASGDDLTGTLVNGGSISGTGSTAWIFGVNTGASSSVTNLSGATISGTSGADFGLGIFTGNGSVITNHADGAISGAAANWYGIGVYGGSSVTVNNSGAIAGTSATYANGVYAGTNSQITNKSGGMISATGTSNTATAYGVYITSGSVVNENGATISATGPTYTMGTTYGVYTSLTGSAVTNAGTILVTGTGTSGGIRTGTSSTVINESAGLIKVSGVGMVEGISMYTGATVVNHGIIEVEGKNGIAVTKGNVTNNGRISVNGSDASGSFGLNLISTCTAVNNGIIGITGSTGNKGAYLDGSGTLTNAATGTITSSGTGVTFRSVSSGAGIVNNSGAITGVTGVSATAGNLTLNNYGAITGTGGNAVSLAGDNNSVVIHEGSTLTGALVASGSNNTLELAGAGNYASDITGSWAVTKSGSGTVVLSGHNSCTGGTTVDSGALSVDGTLASDVFVNADAILMGSGTIVGDVTIGSEARLGPGNSPGTLGINGDFSSSGILDFEIGGLGAGQYDVLDILGNASFLTGGSIHFHFASGFKAQANNHWDFLIAKSISGWDNLAVNFHNLDFGLGWKFEQVAYEEGRISERLWITQEGGTPSVPEPATMMLLGLGLMGLTVVRRKARS